MSAASPSVGRAPSGKDEGATHGTLSRALAAAAHGVRLLAAVTPENLAEERVRLLRELETGGPAIPRFVYARPSRAELRRTLEGIARALPGEVAPPLERLYRERIEELDLEARLAESAGLPDLGPLAGVRFSPHDPETARRARTIAAEWLRTPPPEAQPTSMSDADAPGSLLREMERAVGLLRLPFAVRTSPSLLSLAATSDRTIWVAEGRPVTAEDTRRVVLHEVEGHAVPRARARTKHPLFAIGTARGSDDQEGLALVFEERAGALGAARRRELGARHWAVERMCDGASFADVALGLTRDHGWPLPRALQIVERVFRGTDGRGPGLGRERVYVGAFLRVRDRLAARPADEAVLTSGQVAVDAIDRMRDLL